MTIIQFPNKPLIIMGIAWIISRFSTGYIYSFSRSVFIVAGIIWSYEELAHGVNWFRKLLGAVVLLIFLMSLGMELNR